MRATISAIRLSASDTRLRMPGVGAVAVSQIPQMAAHVETRANNAVFSVDELPVTW